MKVSDRKGIATQTDPESCCRSPKTKSFEGTRICVAAGPAIKNRRRNESQKRISWREGFKADDASPAFHSSLLIFRVLPNETQAQSQFGTPTRNINRKPPLRNFTLQAPHAVQVEVISAERVQVLAHQRRCQAENVVIAVLALSTQLIRCGGFSRPPPHYAALRGN